MVIPKFKEPWDPLCLSVVSSKCEEPPQYIPDPGIKKLSYTGQQNIKIAYKKYYKSLCRYAAKQIKDSQYAEDIVADAFLSLIQQLDRISVDEMENMLYDFVDLNCSEYISYHQFINQGVSEFDILTEDDEAEIEAELDSLIRDELRRLPPQRKKIMLHLYMEGLTSGEVAQRMKLSRQTVINQKVKALKALRDNIMKRFSFR
jgi:RNA polymerase sigma-70 factor (ECF subfamily)